MWVKPTSVELVPLQEEEFPELPLSTMWGYRRKEGITKSERWPSTEWYPLFFSSFGPYSTRATSRKGSRVKEVGLTMLLQKLGSKKTLLGPTPPFLTEQGGHSITICRGQSWRGGTHSGDAWSRAVNKLLFYRWLNSTDWEIMTLSF